MLKKVFLLLILIIIIIFVVKSCTLKDNHIDLYQKIIQNDKIIVGVSYDSKPFSFKDSDGQVKGIEADLAKEIAKRLLGDENKVVFKDVTPQDRIKSVKNGDVDMVISTMTINPQRKKLVDFSAPYFVAGQVICVKKDSKIDVLYDLINKRVIVILGTTGEQNIKKFAPNALIQGYVDNTEALDAFEHNLGDAIITDDALLLGFVLENTNYIILPERLSKEPYGIAFKKSDNASIFRKNINKIMEEIRTDGTLRKIKYNWGLS